MNYECNISSGGKEIALNSVERCLFSTKAIVLLLDMAVGTWDLSRPHKTLAWDTVVNIGDYTCVIKFL